VSFFDPLNKLNSSIWWLSDNWSNGFPFLSSWSDDTVKFDENGMNISIVPTSSPESGFPYESGELRSHDYYAYGCFEAEIKPVRESGVITSFFLFAGPHDTPEGGNGRHNEIDIEFLGNNTQMLQINYWTNDDRYENAHEVLIHMNFDAADDFHRYGIKWTEGAIFWYIDGEMVYKVHDDNYDQVPKASDSKLKIIANTWVTDSRISDWAGEFDPESLPLTAYYRNISYTEEAECSLN